MKNKFVNLCWSVPKERTFWDELFGRHPVEITKSKMTEEQANNFMIQATMAGSMYVSYWIEEI
jgi:hypothetical protein